MPRPILYLQLLATLLQRSEALGSASRLCFPPHSQHLRHAGWAGTGGQGSALKGPEQEAGMHAVKRDDQPGPAGQQAIPGQLSPAWPQLTQHLRMSVTCPGGLRAWARTPAGPGFQASTARQPRSPSEGGMTRTSPAPPP